MNITQKIKQHLKDKGYKERGNTFTRIDSWPNREICYTFRGGGWVNLYYREFPASEGWMIKNIRLSQLWEESI